MECPKQACSVTSVACLIPLFHLPNLSMIGPSGLFLTAATARRSMCPQFSSGGGGVNELIKQKCESCGH